MEPEVLSSSLRGGTIIAAYGRGRHVVESRWDPSQYSRFQDERDRAALDLLLRLPDDLQPREIWDLGCGTGQHAALLKRRHPGANVHGLDASDAMIAAARDLAQEIDWQLGRIDDWQPAVPADLILANAVLHWLPDHRSLLPRLVGALAPGGVLAAQMPLRAAPLHHQVVARVAGQGPWAQALRNVPPAADPLSPQDYFDILATECEAIDIWSTTYLHALEGADPVLNWLMGAGLTPHLTALDATPDLRRQFLSALSDALSDAFPMRPSGKTLLPFPRLFLVARRR